MADQIEDQTFLPSPIFPIGSIFKYKTHKCLKCGIGFKKVTDLRKHLFSSTKESRICSVCNQVFSCDKGMKQHYGKMHAKLKPARCNLCKKRYRNKYALKFHIQQVHEKLAQESCPKCGLVMYNSYSVQRHLKICKASQDSDQSP